MEIPVLTYHANNISGNDYDQNDHVALAADLPALTRAGWQIRPLTDVVAWVLGRRDFDRGLRPLSISFDDGSWFDYHDLVHPDCGPQRSFMNILRDFRDSSAGPSQPHLHASSFVITSPAAREELDRKGLIGRGWWGDDWWADAQASGLMSIECHSWDHVHPDLDRVAHREQIKGAFSRVDSPEDCDIQVRQAGDYIASLLNGARPTLFAYPWGEASDYLVREYFPGQTTHGFEAAFTTEPQKIRRDSNRWLLPRYVCGRDWRSPDELRALLERQ